jgi:hypothetical protein
MRRSESGGMGVEFFEELYAIVVGLGLALSVEQVIDLDRAGLPVSAEHLPLFLAYLNIAFALAHASVRYLQLAYVENGLGRLGRGRVIGDLVLGVGHFLWLMALSFLITRPSAFAYAAIALLIGRPLRDGFVMLAKLPRLEFDKKVAAIHIATIGALLATLIIKWLIAAEMEVWTMRVGLLISSLLFGLGMYTFAFPYFFSTPDSAARSSS